MSGSATSCCGISIGTENCYVAVTKSGGIEILLNEYSQRSTPAYVEFGGNQREIGVSAKQKQMMNIQTTVFAPTTIIGKKFSELNRDEIPYNIEENEKGEVSIRVVHNGEELVFTATQVLAMLFTKLRQISGNPVDCVLNCPTYFTEPQRQALLGAAQIAGLNPLKIITDLSATALYYGFYRGAATATQDTSIVAFVDAGHSATQASIVMFNHKDGQMRVLSADGLPDVGGKDFDAVLANHFIQQQKLQLNKRAKLRLLAECEKMKKQMSANSNELPINIECLYNDKDFSARLDRTSFEALSEGLLNKIKTMLLVMWERASERFERDFPDKAGTFKIDSVEVVGGTSRIPAIKRIISSIFKVEPSTTLNADEAVARGCALQCAILSPTYKVRELQIVDLIPYQINFQYVFESSDVKSVNSLFPRGHQYPFTKQVTINLNKLPVLVTFSYVKDATVPYAEYVINEKPGSGAAELLAKYPIKLRVKVNTSGLTSISSATISYEKPAEEQMETDQQATFVCGNKENNGEQETKKSKSKPKVATIDLAVEARWISGQLSQEELTKFIEFESNMILADKNWKEKTDSKNTLEEFLYEWRDRLETGSYDAFIDDQTKVDFAKKIEENSGWLTEQDDQCVMHSKSVYDERTNSMNDAFAKGIIHRKREFENRPRVLEQFGQRLQHANKIRSQPVAHQDDQEDWNKFGGEIDEKQQWFDEVAGKLSTMNTTANPEYSCDEIQQQMSGIDSSIQRYQNACKRRSDTREAAAKKAQEEKKKQQDAANAAAAAAAAPANNGDGQPVANGNNMEVDDQQVPA